MFKIPKKKVQLTRTDRPALHQIGSNIFVLGERPSEPGKQSAMLEQVLMDRGEGRISLKPTQPYAEKIEERNPVRRRQIDQILRTSKIPKSSQVTVINLLRIINRSLKTSAERDVALRAIKTFLGE